MNIGNEGEFNFGKRESKIVPKRVALVLQNLAAQVEPLEYLTLGSAAEPSGNWEEVVAAAVASGTLEELEEQTAADLQLFIDMMIDGTRTMEDINADKYFLRTLDTAVAIDNYKKSLEAEKD